MKKQIIFSTLLFFFTITINLAYTNFDLHVSTPLATCEELRAKLKQAEAKYNALNAVFKTNTNDVGIKLGMGKAKAEVTSLKAQLKEQKCS